MKNIIYQTKGTCSREISISVIDGIVKDISFVGGCPGNLRAIEILVKDMKVSDIVKKLSGITCGDKKTSCADQLAQALKKEGL